MAAGPARHRRRGADRGELWCVELGGGGLSDPGPSRGARIARFAAPAAPSAAASFHLPDIADLVGGGAALPRRIFAAAEQRCRRLDGGRGIAEFFSQPLS